MKVNMTATRREATKQVGRELCTRRQQREAAVAQLHRAAVVTEHQYSRRALRACL